VLLIERVKRIIAESLALRKKRKCDRWEGIIYKFVDVLLML
jgi:hypothetical protein